MDNFYRLASGIVVSPLMAQIKANNDLWGENPMRAEYTGSAHSDVVDIWLRFNETDPFNGLEAVDYPAFTRLPSVRSIIFGLMGMVEGERLGKCIITKLKPGGVIAPHIDEGLSPEYYQRYHIPLNSEPGSLFLCGDEIVGMQTGDVWWVNNREMHEVKNNSADDRIHLIVEIKH